MTVSNSTSRVSYNGNGSTTSFSIPFYFLANSDILVSKLDTNVTPNVETTFVLGTDYNLSGAGDLAGGTLTTIGTLASGENITIERNLDYTQSTDYEPFGRFPAETLEQNIDRLTMIAQENKALIDRAFLLDRTTSFLNSTIEEPSAGAYLRYDASGNIINGDSSAASSATYAYPASSAVTKTVTQRLAESISVLDFDVDRTGVSDSTAGFTAAINAIPSGGCVLRIPRGTYLVDAFTLPDGVVLEGDGVGNTTLRFQTGNSGTNDCINMGTGCELRSLTMEPVTKDATYSVLPVLFPAGVFDYSSTIDAPRLGENCRAVDCVFDGFNSGLQADSDNVYVDRIVSKGGYAACNFYDVDGFTIENSQFFGGTYACMGLPSCKNGRVVGNYLQAPGSTGINPGGSAAAGFNVENITISSNVVVGTNGVTSELGVNGITITNNIILIANPVSTDGVGIGVATRTGGTKIQNITITGNSIRPLDASQAYGLGIYVANEATAPNLSVDNVSITGNLVAGATQAITLEALVSYVIGATISSNRVLGGRFGLYLGGVRRGTFSENTMEADSPGTISNYYGILYTNLEDCIITENIIRGYGEHIRQTGASVSGVSLLFNKHLPNDDAASYVQYNNASGGSADALLREYQSAPAAFASFPGGGSPGAVTAHQSRAVASIVKNSTGNYTVTLDRTFTNATPAIIATAGDSTTPLGAGASVTTITASTFIITTFNTTTGTATDYDHISFNVIGV